MWRRYNTKYDDPELAATVLRRDAIRERHRRLAARDNQVTLSREMGVPQSIISKLIRTGCSTTQLTPQQHFEILGRYAQCRHHTAVARQHSGPVLCKELGICHATRVRIINERKKLKQQRKRQAYATAPPVHRFLTMRLAP